MYNPLINEYRGRFGRGRTMADIVGCIEDIPPMPDVIRQALRLVDDVETVADELADVIMLDPALASPILRSANSASQGRQREISTLAEAVQVVGMGRIKTMLVASALRRWYGNFGPPQRLVWEKSLGAASAARVLCEHLNKRYRDELNLTGLLHNLGQIVLLSHKEFGGIYPEVLKRIRECDEDYVTAEREIIGFSHPLIGAMVARKWDFPQSTCRAILHYADPFNGITGEEDEKLGVLKLAAGLGLALGFGRPGGYSVDMKELETLACLVGFNQATLETDLQASMREIENRFTAEVSAYA